MSKYLLIFALTLFFIISITGPGIFLNDEWIVAQEEVQLTQGHQLVTNEGKYGYFANGTASNYITARHNHLVYSLALPLLSLPLNILFIILSTDYTRIFIIGIWIILGIYLCYKYKSEISDTIGDILVGSLFLISLLNIVLYTPYIMQGTFIPSEMVAISLTNILIIGIFSVIIFKISELLFEVKTLQIVSWISCLSLTSLLFWAGTLKDHVLSSTIVLAICYYQMLYMKYGNTKHLTYTCLLSGLLMWVRPEIGLFVGISILIFNIYYIRKDIITIIHMGFWICVGSIPLFLNNILITGNPIISPFLTSSSTDTSQNGNMVIETVSSFSHPSILSMSPMDFVYLLFSPLSGSIGLIVPFCLFIFSILVYIKYRCAISQEIKLMIIVGIASIFYYLTYTLSGLGSDSGITPDIRYFTSCYALFTLFAIYVISKCYTKLNYKNMIKNVIIYVPVILLTSLFLIVAVPSIGSTFKTFRIIPNIISTLALALLVIYLINDRSIKIHYLEKLIALVISSALSWQIIMIFIYHVSKAHHYAMFLPVSEILQKLIFGG